jgi:hypothetical protein
MVSAWMDPPNAIAIFGENLFEKKSLEAVFLSLIGANKGEKPFECVGTFQVEDYVIQWIYVWSPCLMPIILDKGSIRCSGAGFAKSRCL